MVQSLIVALVRPPLATELVLAHNGWHSLDDCLQPILDQDSLQKDYQILAVDNASADGSTQRMAARYLPVLHVRPSHIWRYVKL